MTFFHFPLVFSAEQESALRKEYALFSDALEKQAFLPSDYLDGLTTRLRKALDALQITNYEHFRQNSGLSHHLAHFTHDDYGILNLPWGLAIGEAEHLYFSRGASLREKSELCEFVPTTEGPLRILVMVAAPETDGERGRLRYEDEQMQIAEAFGPLLRRGDIEIHFTADGSEAALRQALDAPRYDIFHFSGHSEYSVADWATLRTEGFLLLEDERSMQPRRFLATDFAALLNERPDKQPSLVFLSSCQSAQGGGGKGYTGVTGHLLEAGIPGVVAMSHSVSDVFATLFTAQFYKGLSDGFSVPLAFSKALKISRKGNSTLRLPAEFWISQSLIPQLYLNQNIQLLTKSGTPKARPGRRETGKFWQTGRLREKLQKIHRFAGRDDKDFIFIGRRREQKAIRRYMDKAAPIYLQGQGGIGKTALAVHTAERLVLADPDEIQVFMFDENTFRIGQVTDELLLFLKNEQKQILRAHEIKSVDKAWDKFLTALQEVVNRCKPVFIFDNLESFQLDGGGDFLLEYTLEWDIVTNLAEMGLPLLLTGRYPLPVLPNLCTVPLHEPTRPDFAVKCRYLTISEKIPQGPEGKPVFETLFRSFGGNYRALEFFDTFYCEKNKGVVLIAEPSTTEPGVFELVIETLEGFIQKHQAQPELLAKMSENLVFERLLGLLNESERKALILLAQFRRPVLSLALERQDATFPDVAAVLERLSELTLAEKNVHDTGYAFFYVSTLTCLLLERDEANKIELDDQKAGEYYEYVDENINYDTIDDLQEAFFYFARVMNLDKVNEIGGRLGSFLAGNAQFQNALSVAEQAFKICGEQTTSLILNGLGNIFRQFGEADRALFFYKKKLKKDKENLDREGEGLTLISIATIYFAKAEYDKATKLFKRSLKICQAIGNAEGEAIALHHLGTTAYAKSNYKIGLQYLEQSLEIQHNINDQQTKGTTLNNISLIYSAQGDYATALNYLEQSLEIVQAINDKVGEGTALNNLAANAYSQRNLDAALKYLEQSLKIQQAIGDRTGETRTINNIGQIYSMQGNYNIALEYFERSLKIIQHIGVQVEEAIVLNNISMIYKEKGDYDQAISYLKHSLEINKLIDNRAGMCSALHNMATLYFEQKEEINEFIEKEENALHLAIEIDYVEGIFEIGRSFGLALCENGIPERGVEVLSLALEVGERAGFPGIEQIEANIQFFSK